MLFIANSYKKVAVATQRPESPQAPTSPVIALNSCETMSIRLAATVPLALLFAVFSPTTSVRSVKWTNHI